jgi:hypothetical protein
MDNPEKLATTQEMALKKNNRNFGIKKDAFLI